VSATRYELKNCVFEARTDPPRLTMSSAHTDIIFEGQALQLLHRAVMDACGVKYEVFHITGVKDPEPGAST